MSLLVAIQGNSPLLRRPGILDIDPEPGLCDGDGLVPFQIVGFVDGAEDRLEIALDDGSRLCS
jgi:hypothetical protein